jgi:hypothetical protein
MMTFRNLAPAALEAFLSPFDNPDPRVMLGVVKTPTTPALEKLAKDPALLKQLFTQKVAEAQRGLPEDAMLRVQRAYGGGVLNPAVEHTGDLTHRIAEAPTWDTGGREFVGEKVANMLRRLKSEYGFGREVEENIANNARYYNVPVDEYRQKVQDALGSYVAEHQQIPVFNTAQLLANDAAIKIGQGDYRGAQGALQGLERRLNTLTPEQWTKWVHQVDPDLLDIAMRQAQRKALRQLPPPPKK